MKKQIFFSLLLFGLLTHNIGAQSELNSQLNNLYYQLKGDLLCSNGQMGATIRALKDNNFVENRFDQPKSALYISVSNAGFDLPDIKIKAATRFTIAFWVYASKEQTITNFFGRTSDSNLSIADASGLKTAAFPSFTFLSEGDKKSLPTQEWFFMTISYKDGLTTVFVNNEATPRIKYSYNDFDRLNTSLDFGFGFTDDNRQTFVGSISDLHVYNTCLTSADRLALYERQEGVAKKEEPKKLEPAPPIVIRGTDKTPPQIKLSNKTRDLGIAPINTGSNINFSGDVIDPSGIKYVSINGVLAKINKIDDFKSTFDYTAVATVGNNTFTVQAEDMQGNIATEKISINVAEPKIVKKDNPNKKILDEPTKQSLASAGFFALIIGVSDYEDETMTLDNTVRDAQKVQTILQGKYGFKEDNTFFLEDPDKEEIMEAFADLQKQMSENDNLLIFYAGHGNWDKITKKSYWLPVDADRNIKTNWISSVDIADQLAALPAQHILIVSDACFSGGLLKTRDISHESEDVYNTLYRKKSRRIITSGDLETVPDESVFIKYFVKSLEENNKDYFSEDDFFQDFRKAVIANSPNGQVPQNGVLPMSGDEGGNFIFRIDRNADNLPYEQPDREEEPQAPEEYGDGEDEEPFDYESEEEPIFYDALISQTADCMCEKINLVLKLKKQMTVAFTSEKEAIQNKIDAIMVEFSTCVSELDGLYRELSVEEQTDIKNQMTSELDDKCGAALKELNAP
jgi:hypothetical protein